jgi:CubicO group peptidase (beta-lactamase class C family)
MQLAHWNAYRVALVVLALASSSPVSASLSADALSALDAFIVKTLHEYQVPGAAVAIVHDDQVVWLKGYGVRDITKPDKVDAQTIFQLASLTKTFTGAAAGVLVDQGKLDWDTPIFNYVPEFAGYDPYMTRWLTTRDLLAQRTGWPQFAGDMVDSFGYDRADIVRRLRYFKPRYSLRAFAQYSNMGFFLAGEVAAHAAGQSWNALVEHSVLTPLEMSRSSTVTPKKPEANSAAAHAVVDGKIHVVEPTILNTTGAASSMTSTAADMAKFMQMYLGKGTYNGKPVLKPATVAEIFKRSMVSEVGVSEVPPISETTGFYYGLGVGSYDYAGSQIIEKGGALAGVRTLLTLVPEKNTGIVILANMNLTTFPEAVRAFYVQQLFGRDPNQDQQAIMALNSAIATLVAPPPAPPHPQPFAGTLPSLVGVYENDYYGRCAIVLNGSALRVGCGPATYPATLHHWNAGAFAMQFPGATQGPAITTFTIGADGKADSFTHTEFGVFSRVKEKE